MTLPPLISAAGEILRALIPKLRVTVLVVPRSEHPISSAGKCSSHRRGPGTFLVRYIAIRSEAMRIAETSAADQTACVVHSPLSETRLRRARPIGRLTLAVNTGDVNCSLDLQTQG